ncbi:MAG: hypothetical protein UX12_C0014G0004 [Candidatus Collierbacteria bacterium GW2011_GWC1_45_47]|uniref:Uncharacterized protein n=4 Tax=Candidatus Collieribacteriota TaxID=1752725 RepID=A0A0G1KDM7_9BACT|nr:MAG: hypothetical protein UW23_C0004G0010 [Candidatus Collierbacteria bacterium GW2011_GWA1_44_12]KKT39194.1 MAG: hypothetical protein UW26_C0007G0011 [Candidatus Collierbacteria bacterium GW2011_GWF1_44_12]KKT45939.1 MAG: hypothetical protein UW35_C0027G0018 [Candidatus Collierbacteria bacterium GW2011_GWF2_44_15]KKT98556.1 MAG: hypothetical protein UW99_C0022G0004 [Candidatus Collierbacteria bacterium GW2011_GWC2_45_15]KKU09405.1 MAG: hypothetical protein UX12_C0014G0004 [Candidatus Collie
MKANTMIDTAAFFGLNTFTFLILTIVAVASHTLLPALAFLLLTVGFFCITIICFKAVDYYIHLYALEAITELEAFENNSQVA